MKMAIMQPYFLPYVGYYQLIAAVDTFVVYDNIQYTKKGWINRNRMLRNGSDVTFSLPIKKDSDYLDVVQRELAPNFDRKKLLNQFKGAYGRAPFFEQSLPLLERVVCYENNNLFRYIYHSIVEICAYLGIKTKIEVSSEIEIDHDQKGQEKVISLCKALSADTYINSIGGMDLYGADEFSESGISLKFIRPKPFEYQQFGAEFVPWLSFVDVLVFNEPEVIRSCVNSNFDLI